MDEVKVLILSTYSNTFSSNSTFRSKFQVKTKQRSQPIQKLRETMKKICLFSIAFGKGEKQISTFTRKWRHHISTQMSVEEAKKGQRISYDAEIKNIFEISKSDLAAWFLCRTCCRSKKSTSAYSQSKRKKPEQKERAKKNPRRKRVVRISRVAGCFISPKHQPFQANAIFRYTFKKKKFPTSPRQMGRKYCRWNVNGATNSRRLRNDILTMTTNQARARTHTHTIWSGYFCVYIDIGEALLLSKAQNVSNYRHQFRFETYPFYCIFVFSLSSGSRFLSCWAIEMPCHGLDATSQNDCSHSHTVYVKFSHFHKYYVLNAIRWKKKSEREKALHGKRCKY